MSMSNEEARSILEPIMAKYEEALNTGNSDVIQGFYHENAVMVETGKSCLYGKKAITDSLLELTTVCGKTVLKLSNSRYEGVGDFVNIHTDFVFETEKSGDLKGIFTQIWKKENGVYTIYHDEYSLI